MEAAELVDRYARAVEQAAILQGAWRQFRLPGIAGAVAYRGNFRTAFVPGDPLCPTEAAAPLLKAFLDACRRSGWHAVLAPVSLDVAVALARLGCAGWKIGETPVFDLSTWTSIGKAGAKLRAAVNRAHRGGVSVHEWLPGVDAPLPGDELGDVYAAWLAHRRALPLGFVLADDPLALRPGRRWFVARRAAVVQAFVVTMAFAGGRTVVMEHFIRRPDAEYGSVNAAILAAFRAGAVAGATTASLGTAPLAGMDHRATAANGLLVGRADRGHRICGSGLQFLRRHGAAFYRARSLEHFKAQFAPSLWEPCYLMHFPGPLRPRMALAALAELLPARPSLWTPLLVGGIRRWTTAQPARRSG